MTPSEWSRSESILFIHNLVAGMLARSQYSEDPATGPLDTGFSRFPRVYKQMLRWFPTFQVATTCFSCSPPDLNLLDPHFMFMYVHNNHCHRATAHLKLNILLSLLSSSSSYYHHHQHHFLFAGYYTYIPETKKVPREYSVAANLLLLLMNAYIVTSCNSLQCYVKLVILITALLVKCVDCNVQIKH